jgi:hypothetical protein
VCRNGKDVAILRTAHGVCLLLWTVAIYQLSSIVADLIMAGRRAQRTPYSVGTGFTQLARL